MEETKEERLPIVARLYSQGLNARDIAKRLNNTPLKTSAATISDEIEVLKREWREQSLNIMEEQLFRELSQIDYTIRELWNAWEQSKVDRTKFQRKTASPNEKGELKDGAVVSEITERETSGDLNIIREIRKQQQERRLLLGMYNQEMQVKVETEQQKMLSKEQEEEIARIALNL